jgi:cobalt-precorrin 5A hydrolase/precorrin-3B C17-methyltransferase
MNATLYGVGVGPGDPDLITVKARDVLRSAAVIAYPAPTGGMSLVRAIADRHIPPDRTEIVIETPMTVERFPAADVYDQYATVIGDHLRAGQTVAILCEGDPFFYGSFMYLYERLAPAFETVVVPGVSSLCAVAAVSGTPLVSRNEVLSVVPATLDEMELERRLVMADTVAIIKIGRHLSKVRRVLNRLGWEQHAHYVERATMAEQRVEKLANLAPITAPYFSMILVASPHRQYAPEAQSASIPKDAALVALTSTGAAMARRLQTHLPGSRVHGLRRRVDDSEVSFQSTTTHMRDLFTAGTPIVAFCASGILIRALAPVIEDKISEPPVIAVSEDGRFAVPLLGGHHGANRLADHIAWRLGGIAPVTNAGETKLGVALDDPPPGWALANPDDAKEVAATLIAGGSARLTVEAGNADWLSKSNIAFDDGDGDVTLCVTDQHRQPAAGELVYHPPVLVIGVGCERDTDPDELIALVESTLGDYGLSPSSIACVTSLDLKSDEVAVHVLADTLGVPARFFSADRLLEETQHLVSPSDAVFKEVGCYGVAEGAALAAVGKAGSLIVPKIRSKRATCAIARATGDIVADQVGKPRGNLHVVGIGPGDAIWRTPAATNAISAADTVIGYRLYLDLLGSIIDGKTIEDSMLGEEEQRARKALDLAAEGRHVALVSSGDAGIYALATLVFELVDTEKRADWNRIAIDVIPGVSALQAAAAQSGAPLGHDFCAISLSDLMTPWPVIEQRLQAATDGDFVVALFNPASERRQHQLPTAREIFLTRRSPETPVLLCRSLGRPAERIDIVTLGSLSVDDVDMMTLVIIGNSQTKVVDFSNNKRVYTPRGYLEKNPPSSKTPAYAGGGE